MWTLDRSAALPAWRFASDPNRRGDSRPHMSFSTRQGGVSRGPYRSLNLGRSTDDDPDAVTENRHRWLKELGLDPASYANAGQVHGRTVTNVRAPGLHRDCDVLVTSQSNLTLAVTAADCLPLLFAAPGAVAAAHSGWRGTADGAPEAALSAVCAAANTGPDRVEVHVGPGIRGCCYQVGPDVAARFPAPAVRRDRDGLWLDLPTAVRLRLIEAGVAHDAIHDTGACTACEPDWYFSHRRDRGLTGRQWGIIALR